MGKSRPGLPPSPRMRNPGAVMRSRLSSIRGKKEVLGRKLKELSFELEQLDHEDHALDSEGKRRRLRSLSKEEKEKAKEAEQRRKEEAEELVQKLEAEKKEREHRVQERIGERIKRIQEATAEEAVRAKQAEEERKKAIKEEDLQRHKYFREKQQEELRRIKEQQEKFHVLPESKYFYKKAEERYNREVLLPMLETKKQELALKRNFAARVSSKEIAEHSRKHEELMKERERQRLGEYRKKKEEELQTLRHQRLLRGAVSNDIKKEYAEAKELAEKERLKKRSYRAKMVNYSELVRELRPVVVDSLKAAELKKMVNQLRHPVRERRNIKDEYSIDKIRALRLQSRTTSTCDKPKHSIDVGVLSSIQPSAAESRVELTVNCGVNTSCDRNPKRSSSRARYKLKRVLNKNAEDKQHHSADKRQSRSKPDYLEEMRKRRGGNYTSLKPHRYDWEADIKDPRLNSAEKCEKVMEKAAMMEENALMKEQVLEVSGGAAKNFEMGNYVSGMLLDSIRAKLAVLESL